MFKRRATVILTEEVLCAVRLKAARSGTSSSEVIEESLRRDLGIDLLERLWTKADMPADDAASLALEAQHAARAQA